MRVGPMARQKCEDLACDVRPLKNGVTFLPDGMT